MSDFKLGYIFTDNCVLQRGRETAVFGTAPDGCRVTVRLGSDVAVTVASGGSFRVLLPPQGACDGLILTAECEEEVLTCRDVAIGEVWLAGGQSNMEFELHNAVGGEEMLLNDSPDVRFFYTPKCEFEDERCDRAFSQAHWETFNPVDARKWSAVGYIFAKHLSERLGVTVGVVGCNWGGTSASNWVAEEDLKNAPPFVRVYWEDYEKLCASKPLSEQKKEYEDFLALRAEKQKICDEMYRENPLTDWNDVVAKLGTDWFTWPNNAYSCIRPSGLYKTMLRHVIGYTYAGVIYYQGESDDHRPHAYYELFKRLVRRWRTDNGDPELPFIAVMLPMHRYDGDPDYKHWPVIRQAQKKVTLDLHHMGIAVCTDCGERNEIHPKDKRAVGYRLYLQALWLAYKLAPRDLASAPWVYALEFKDGGAYLHCEFTGGGFKVKGDKITGFEAAPFKKGLCEEDYVPADCKILDGNTLFVSAPGIKVGHVRYLYTNYGEVSLYGDNDLPLEPVPLFYLDK